MSYKYPGVYVEEVASSSGTLTSPETAIAAFVGFTEKGPNEPTLVTSWTQYEKTFGGFVEGALLPLSVAGYFDNGGKLAYIVRIPHTMPSTLPSTKALSAGDKSVGAAVEFESLPGATNIKLDISAEEPKDAEKEGDPDPDPSFTITITGDAPATDDGDSSEEDPAENPNVFTGVTLENIEQTINGTSTLVKVASKVKVDDIYVDLRTLPVGEIELVEAAPTPVDVKPRAFAGSETARTGIKGLTIAEDVTMLLVPDLATVAGDNHAMWTSVQTAMIDHCELHRNRMAILDTPQGLSTQEVSEWRNSAMYSSPFAALYYPWVEVDNPTGTNGNSSKMIPPSGHVAGIWARTDSTRGVHKAPANEKVNGITSLESKMTKEEQGLLNPDGINCIRALGTQGMRVWGARTLGDPSGDWRYINVRRLFNMIQTAIMDGTQFAVFEPNDKKLWEGLKRTVNGYLTGLWRDGALFGNSADQAFFVKCDEENNPQDSIDAGQVIVEVGIAPVKPAEFVIFRISQKKGDDA